jgi:hypothetical protein
MIAHLVMYELKAGITDEERDAFARALDSALSAIPAIRRARVGRRLRHVGGYEAQMPDGYDLVGVLEFEDRDALRAYLEHPAHEALGRLFWSCCARTLVFDYDLTEADAVRPLAEHFR